MSECIKTRSVSSNGSFSKEPRGLGDVADVGVGVGVATDAIIVDDDDVVTNDIVAFGVCWSEIISFLLLLLLLPLLLLLLLFVFMLLRNLSNDPSWFGAICDADVDAAAAAADDDVTEDIVAFRVCWSAIVSLFLLLLLTLPLLLWSFIFVFVFVFVFGLFSFVLFCFVLFCFVFFCFVSKDDKQLVFLSMIRGLLF